MDLKDPKTQKLILIVAGTAALVYFYIFADFVPFNYKARAAEISLGNEEIIRKLAKSVQTAWSQVATLKKMIEDETDSNGMASGTTVRISIPVKLTEINSLQ
jgi:hypothetical protein